MNDADIKRMLNNPSPYRQIPAHNTDADAHIREAQNRLAWLRVCHAGAVDGPYRVKLGAEIEFLAKKLEEAAAPLRIQDDMRQSYTPPSDIDDGWKLAIYGVSIVVAVIMGLAMFGVLL